MRSLLRINESSCVYRFDCDDDSSSKLLLRNVLDHSGVHGRLACIDGAFDHLRNHHGSSSGSVHAAFAMGLLVVVFHLLHCRFARVLPYPSSVRVLEYG